MKIDDVLASAFAMPLTCPSYPPGPYRFVDREFLIVTYRTDLDLLRAVVPEPLEVTEPLVKYEFIRMPDSTGFGDYTESGQVIPVRYRGQAGGYVHAMYLNDEAPSFLLKIIPHVDCTPRICELVRYRQTGITVKGAWGGPAGLELHHHALAPVARLPVLETVSAVHILADLTLGLGEVVHDYLSATPVHSEHAIPQEAGR